MSYHRSVRSGLGMMPAFTSTTAFAQAVDPYTNRFSPPGSIYSPYGWGPDMNIGMPMNYTHHIGYEPTPIPGARPLGPMRDQLSGIPGAGEWHYYSARGGQPRCTFESEAKAVREALQEARRQGTYVVVTRRSVPMFAVTASGDKIPVGGCGSPCCALREEHLHVADPCGMGSPMNRPVGRVALGADPYAPSYRKVPYTNRDDVKYVPLGYHHYYSGVFESGPTYEGDSQRLAGLGGILAVM